MQERRAEGEGKCRGGHLRQSNQAYAPPVRTRAQSLDELAERRFDLLVVGGGIIGAGIAAHAARAGLAVALVEAGDFGGATSSASSKLIHGGLRYLRLGDVGLVREAHHERRVLTKVVAPHLVRRLPFLVPLYEGGPYRPAVVQSGILVYSALARSRLNWLVSPQRARELVPSLRGEGLRSCALYADATTNDARLCLANVTAAAEAGACVLNGARVVALRMLDGRVRGAEVSADGEEISVDARLVVNATGPWVDHLRRLEDPNAGTSVRLSRGAHVIVPADRDWSAALTIPQDGVRVTFAVPWYGMFLLGTTDSPYEGDPAAVSVEPTDVEQILAEASVALDQALLGPDAVRASYAGLRALPLGEERQRQCAARDGLHSQPGRHAQRGRGEAHDLPQNRASGARSSPSRARASPDRQAALAASRCHGARPSVATA